MVAMKRIIPRIPYDVGAESEPYKYAGDAIVHLEDGSTYDMNAEPPRRRLPPLVFADGQTWDRWYDDSVEARRELARLMAENERRI